MASTVSVTAPPIPCPPPLALDQLLAPAIAAHDLDQVLKLVQRYAEQAPAPDRPLLAPVAGLHSLVREDTGPPLNPAHGGSWFHLLLYNAGNAALRADEPAMAVELYKQSLIGCTHPSIFNNIACALKRQGRMQEALLWYLRATERDPAYTRGYLRAAALIVLQQIPAQDLPGLLRRFTAQGGTTAEVREYIAELEAPAERDTLTAAFSAFIPLDRTA